ncbi:type II secretion system protein [Ruficoccus amylovorans]|uniref:Type II secretion system protein n=1 Tax=Ruficoccus amylovorans TaxID=1804625 RepID=A0A842HCM2_9BACT|nr:type II secretion system protein [Ruficoccus amylovorans]MBC2594172.1 type II secretion system protein [Ruficoccus amylovorans]
MMKRKAFTLIELLSVIAVLAILLSIIMSAVGNIRFLAEKNQSASNIRELATANLIYAQDHGHFSPPSNLTDTIWWHGKRQGGDFDGTGGYLSDYLEGGAVRICPIFKRLLAENEGVQFDRGTGGYGYNTTYYARPDMMLEPIPSGATRGSYQPWWARGNLPVNITAPSRTVMFTSTAIVRMGGIVETGNSVPYRHLQNGQLGERSTPTCHFRFRGEAVVAWGDGHVTFEKRNTRIDTSQNVYGDNNSPYQVGFFGSVEWNGFWNPRAQEQLPY